VIKAFVPGSYGQQSGLWSEHPMAGYSITSLLDDPVTKAKYGTVQLPVISGRPANVAVGVLDVDIGGISVITLPVIVLNNGLTEDEVVVAEDAVDDPAVVIWLRLMLARALDNPAGEHPTKSGAVSLTAAHSCLLNWIAAIACQQVFSCCGGEWSN
jgi:hypothetical protein